MRILSFMTCRKKSKLEGKVFAPVPKSARIFGQKFHTRENCGFVLKITLLFVGNSANSTTGHLAFKHSFDEHSRDRDMCT